jgi:hypothetical protein
MHKFSLKKQRLFAATREENPNPNDPVSQQLRLSRVIG